MKPFTLRLALGVPVILATSAFTGIAATTLTNQQDKVSDVILRYSHLTRSELLTQPGAMETYHEEVDVLGSIQRKIIRANEIDVYLLDPNSDAKPTKRRFRGQNILKAINLRRPQEVSEMVSAWTNVIQEMFFGVGSGTVIEDHQGIHGLHFRAGNEVLWEVTIDWLCNNFMLDEKQVKDCALIGLPNATATTRRLALLMERILPVPEEVYKRRMFWEPGDSIVPLWKELPPWPTSRTNQEAAGSSVTNSGLTGPNGK